MAPRKRWHQGYRIYFPSGYGSQAELEEFLHAYTGNSTIGLGQTAISFCDDRKANYQWVSSQMSIRSYSAVSSYSGTDVLLSAGRVAMLIGPHTPLVGEPLQASCIAHTYDFYKPDLKREHPVVDGHYSSRCYLQALGATNDTQAKIRNRRTSEGDEDGPLSTKLPVDEFDFFVFHVPHCKLIAKAYGRLHDNDFLAVPENPLFSPRNNFSIIRREPYEASFDYEALERLFTEFSPARYRAVIFSVPGLGHSASGAHSRKSVSVQFYEVRGLRTSFLVIVRRRDMHGLGAKMASMCRVREGANQQTNYTPVDNIETLAKGTYYLTGVNAMFRRAYAVRQY
ncbi:Hydroxymethylglutaryl-CoA synthase [Penicillium chermesinum]|nr:Hydroxymethylglutaryl-CoA synthase [Penicillium chermesinum]